MVRAAVPLLTYLAFGAEATHNQKAKTHVWRIDAEDPVYPEETLPHLAEREDFGIAIAGGGLRGMATAHGVTRSLRNAGVLDRAKYYSVTSGSIWFGVPLYYQTQDSLDTFIGKTVVPEELTPEILTGEAAGTAITRLTWPIKKFPKGLKVESGGGSGLKQRRLSENPEFFEQFEHFMGFPENAAYCLANLCSCAADLAIPEGSLHELWTLATGLVMHSYGILKRDATHCHASQLEATRAKLGNHTHIYVSQDVEHKLPFLLSQSSVFALKSGTDQKTNPLIAFPLENTPMYTGVPVAITGENLGLEEMAGLGGILVEPFASSSEALEQVPSEAEGEVLVRRKMNRVNLGELAAWEGPGTCYVADWQIRPSYVEMAKKSQCKVTVGEKLMPHFSMWSPLDSDENAVPITRSLAVGDAGVYDDIGHLPLLRRGVKKMVIFDSAAVHDNTTGVEESNIEEMVYLKAAFGAPGGLPPPFGPNPRGSPNPMMAEHFVTVFEPSEFAGLWSKIQERRAAGEPAVIRDNFTVVENPHFGIKGGWTVEIVWVIAMPSNEWRSKLPHASAKHLPVWLSNFGSSEPRSHFELSALSQYASWLMEEVAMKEIRAMLDGDAMIV